MTYEPPASLDQLTNLLPSSISAPRLFFLAMLFHAIIAGEFAKLQKPFPVD